MIRPAQTYYFDGVARWSRCNEELLDYGAVNGIGRSELLLIRWAYHHEFLRHNQKPSGTELALWIPALAPIARERLTSKFTRLLEARLKGMTDWETSALIASAFGGSEKILCDLICPSCQHPFSAKFATVPFQGGIVCCLCGSSMQLVRYRMGE